jgi:acyl-coenzyme A thioesterase PaaI-like protein
VQSVIEIPFNAFLGLETAADPTGVLRLPADEKYLNHLGTVHASAQLALAEATSGEFLLRKFGQTAGVIPVVRRLEAKFSKPAHGPLTSRVTTPEEDLARVETELAAKGRALVGIGVELFDEAGTRTFSAVVEWFLARSAPNVGGKQEFNSTAR